ncbi:uncharacterized protein LOC116915934 [Daphnia magna]|uniref:Uncharacterized protein n=2 Tax=Daphnia magna TaxID=35525 RepID=A0ABR0A491_9CRUS|nr:uncharacterized protein LOC116915934 [Daphnia magna]KAK4019793.1 hypothetical protein OUZ56_001800 [Daphnia magna]KZS21477.1 Uncharacterized protein APZ42_011436 [Daphnia magna]
MLNSRFTWYLVLLVSVHLFVNVQNSDAAEEHQSGHRVVRQLNSRTRLLLGAAGLAALAGSVGLVTGLAIGNRHSRQHDGFRVKRSELGFEIDEAMVLEVAAMDESGCGARLLCELHQEEPSQLNGTISRRLVQIFDGQQAPNFDQLRTEPKAVFQYAAFVGARSAKNLKICAHVFDRCPFSAKIILEVLNIKSASFVPGQRETAAKEEND